MTQLKVMNTLQTVKDKDISKFELRDIIDGITHEILHLERSQEELAFALEEDPADEDFKAAHQENVGAIASKEQRRKELKQYLREIDIAYYMQHYADPVQPPQSGLGATTEGNRSGATGANASTGDNSSSTDPAEPTNSGGVYL